MKKLLFVSSLMLVSSLSFAANTSYTVACPTNVNSFNQQIESHWTKDPSWYNSWASDDIVDNQARSYDFIGGVRGVGTKEPSNTNPELSSVNYATAYVDTDENLWVLECEYNIGNSQIYQTAQSSEFFLKDFEYKFSSDDYTCAPSSSSKTSITCVAKA